MPLSTLTLQSTVDLCSTHADLLPLTGVGGYTNEPALSLCIDAASEIISAGQDWKWNRIELGSHTQPLVTVSNKQSYLFAGATTLSLGANSTGHAIALNGISVAGGVVTVTFLEDHRHKVGDTIYMLGNVMTTGTTANYNSTFTNDGNQSSFSNGWVVASVPTSKTLTFAAITGQNNADAGGAPGILNYGVLTAVTMAELNNNSSPPKSKVIDAVREIPVFSTVGDPDRACVLSDLGTGVIKVRFYYTPGTTTWLVNLIYQAKAPLYTSLTNTWGIPDQYSAMFRQALLYRMYRYLNSPRAEVEYQKLQQEIAKAVGYENSETSNVYLTPEESLTDTSPYWSGF